MVLIIINEYGLASYVHDKKVCKCGACFIDGGNEYTRVGGDFKYIHWVYDDEHEEEIDSKNIFNK